MIQEDGHMEADLSKEDLLRLLACLQSELEARDVVINTLKSEALGSRTPLNYGVHLRTDAFGSSEDPFVALQRDSLVSGDTYVQGGPKCTHDTHLIQLEKLVSSQRFAQEKLREQLQSTQEKYVKTCMALEQQRKCQERNAAQGDNVLIMLEKERDRLRSEVSYEKVQKKKLERILKRVLVSWKQQRLLLARQKQAAVFVIKEHKRLLAQVSHYRRRASDLEAMLSGSSVDPAGGDVSLCDPDSGDVPRETIEKPTDSEGQADVSRLSSGESSLLKQQLTAEVTARTELQRSFDKLQRDYEKLLSLTNPVSITTDSPAGSPLTVTAGQLRDTTSSLLRSKPNLILRRSCDVFSSEGVSSYLMSNGPVAQISPQHSDTASSLVSSDPVTNTISSSSDETASPLSPLTLTLAPQATSLLLSDSRSSTPSPPPPPPPVQLHYPYPSIQSHFHQPQSRTTSGTTHFLSSASGRPLSVPPSQPPQPRSASITQPVTYQQSYQNSTHPINRTQSTSSSAGCLLVPRKTTVTNPSVHHSHTSTRSPNYQPPYSTHFVAPLTKHPSSGPPTFVQRGHAGPSVGQHASATHHFPYSPSRIPPSGGSIHSSMRTLRASSSATPSPAGLSGTNPSIGTGHLCINGK
ncbi:hypothetical protein CRM22_003704 [Opisthorchis felineus]|uniref:Cortactin-binding protein-2 N-terminal domain-containing protein n=1 Tax=Opisthorchis felineus TaxID=147828 RepID=A0A4S2M014_OPIFE|nr:hypothetical protein CRM22_003704 [Opisthorchis felineus]